MKFEIDYIEKLAKIIADNELTEISLEDGEQAITIRKDLAEVVTAPAVAAAPAPVVCQTTVTPAHTVEVEKEAGLPIIPIVIIVVVIIAVVAFFATRKKNDEE